MRRSLNEITVEIRRAFVGAGFDYGLAEEASRSAGALFNAGMDGSAAALEILDCEDPVRKSEALIALLGAFECCIASNCPVTLERVDAPLMLAGTGMQLSASTGTDFLLSSGAGEWRISRTGIEGPAGFAPREPVELRAVPALLRETTGSIATDYSGHEVDEDRWPVVRAWAAKTFVPASEQSRLAGAGAGLTDND